ncbi:MAG: endolytic transglycosylase MltG [Desulfovibrionaceae bacterium]
MKRIFLVIFLSFLFCSYLLYTSAFLPINYQDAIVCIGKGDSLSRIASSLEEQKLIPSSFIFVLIAKFEGVESKLRAGEYFIPAESSPIVILDLLVNGIMKMEQITIPEGLPWWEVARKFEAAGFVTYADFQELITDASFLEELTAFPYSSLEGFLYPETYTFVRPEKASRESTKMVLRSMYSMFRSKTKNLLLSTGKTHKEIYDIIINASIVEKETSHDDERKRVAGVYKNRLQIPMRLQADPTTIYGLGPEFNGNLTRKNLFDETNLYNTYRHTGLPPTPICSPGRDSIEAVLWPEEHEFLFFVAKKNGGRHVFSKEYKDHNAAVDKYQRSSGK